MASRSCDRGPQSCDVASWFRDVASRSCVVAPRSGDIRPTTFVVPSALIDTSAPYRDIVAITFVEAPDSREVLTMIFDVL